MTSLSAPPTLALLALLAMSFGCDFAPVAVEDLPDDAPPEIVDPPVVVATYERIEWSWPRYVLHDDATFALRYGAGAEFPGTYAVSDSVITFDFRIGVSGAYMGQSVGLLRGDTLSVTYDHTLILILGSDWMDFEIFEGSAVYVRAPST